MIAKFENRGVILIFNRIPDKKNSLFKRVYNEYAMIFYLSYHATKQSIFFILPLSLLIAVCRVLTLLTYM